MSVTSYNVTADEDFATIATLSGETKVIFSFTPNLIAVKATGDDASITVARFAGAQSGDDGVRTIASGESTTLEPYNGDKFVYVNGTGGVEVWAGRAGEEIPPSFKKSAKGGEVTLDDNVTQNSENPVKSSGIYTALSSKQNAIQYPVIPTITASMLGQIIQYVGATDANYTKGWFYEAKSDGKETPTYSWEVINFPKSGEGGDVLPSGYQKLEYVRCNGDYAGFTVPYVAGWRHIHEVFTAITSLSSESAFSGIGGYRCEGYYTIKSSEPYLTMSSSGRNADLCADYNVTYDTPQALRFVPSYDYGYTTYLSIGYYMTGYHPFTGRIYRYRVYVANNTSATVDETLLSNSIYLNFVPCKRLSDDKIGFYETVNGDFYSSTTTGAEFLAPSQS